MQMKQIPLYLCFCLLYVFFACAENEPASRAINIQLVSPEGFSLLPYDEIEVTLTNKDQGTTYTSRCSPTGWASFRVEWGYYVASVHYQMPSGVILSGRIESLPLLPQADAATSIVSIALVRSESNALVIKEIYYNGCTGKRGERYLADQYVTLYNNSGQTLYLDGLCVAVVDPTGSVESPWMKYTDMKRIPIKDFTWQFPGGGQENPLLPGAETTIATNAVDHTGGEYQHPNSVDLSKVAFGFSDVSFSDQVITPGVKPMKLLLRLNPSTWLYTFPVIGPALMVFSIQGTSAEAYANDPDNRKPEPEAANPNKHYLMIPREWVIDCVDCVESISRVPFKRVPDELDSGAAFIPEGIYSGKSLIRKKTIILEGRMVYQDTNNSTKDLEISIPTLKNR